MSDEHLDKGADQRLKSEWGKRQPRSSKPATPAVLAHPSSAEKDRLGIGNSVGIFIEDIIDQELAIRKHLVL